MGSEKFLFRLEQPHGQGNVYITWQKNSSNYLVTTGSDGMVNIFNRYGQIQERIKLPGLCTAFEWNFTGDLIGIVSQSTQLILWDANLEKKYIVELNLKDVMTCIFWERNSQMVAIGSKKGNVCLYDHTTSKCTPIIGKHSKEITCGGWNADKILILGSEDKTLSLSNADGDTLKIISLRAEPANVQFSEMKVDKRIGGENTISLIVGKRTLYLYSLFDTENPIELEFQQHYGNIVSYKWFGDGYILLGFALGYFIAISTHIKEVGRELFQVKNYKNSLNDIALCKRMGKVASCGDNIIKIHDLNSLQETSSLLTLPHESELDKIVWSDDGKLLAVSTINGSVNVYVLNVPMLTSVFGTKILVLSNLSEVNLYNFCGNKKKLIPMPIPLETEPSIIAVGPYHFITAINNKAWFYDLTKQPCSDTVPLLLRTKEYLSTITSVNINSEYASILFDGRIELHLIEQLEVEYKNREAISLPDANSISKITCQVLTTDFLIYGTDNGQIVFFHIEDWTVLTTYTHSVGISQIFSDPTGTKIVIIDLQSLGYFYNAVNGNFMSIPDWPSKTLGVVWDSSLLDKNVFIIFDENSIFPYIFQRFSINGPTIQKINEKFTLLSNQLPLLMYSGDIVLAANNGRLLTLPMNPSDESSTKQLERKDLEHTINRHLIFERFAVAFNLCYLLQSVNMWVKLAEEALKHLEVNIALLAYKELRNVAMVYSLEQITNIEDTNLLAGYCSMYLKDYSKAQKWFLNSHYPQASLQMQRDLLQWDHALELSKKLAPDQLPFISREYAHQLESIGNYSEAYILYDKGLTENVNENIEPQHVFICKCGTARTTIRCGNYKQGIIIANEVNNRELFIECANILASMKQYQEAAFFYEKAQVYDKAASTYIKIKNWKKVEELLPNITSNKIYSQYAKAKELEGKYKDSLKAYYMANDFDSVIRLELDYLNNPTAAVELAEETKSVEGFRMVARFFQRINDYFSTIKFLVMARDFEEAFELTKKQKMFTYYGDVLLNTLSLGGVRHDDFHKLALHFEHEKDYLLAGKYFFHARDYNKALDHLLRASKSTMNQSAAISLAIEAVASSNNQQLAARLIEFLLGETDGNPKDPKYLFQLYMARKQYKDATKSALIIANEEQINGNYKNARDILFNMYQELKINGISIPQDMYHTLMLLHSYILVRLHIRRGNHLLSARLLLRVAENISKFPTHIVPILTSTVIECYRADLKHSAYKYATSLIQNQNYRKQIDSKYLNKIESIIRKAPKNSTSANLNDDLVESVTSCPYCGTLFPEMETFCSGCKKNVPVCIVTNIKYRRRKTMSNVSFKC
ncbi:WD repeat-containing protein 19 isoform X2 [Agrilus planipennis]|uniref:WD repeat-containing protein 19 isoform X2 n=1 Tax=Agrilus planipennis TaxID=224129 RepID=A0A1W4XIS5_AGRPL|nr:WD repeat-containing protein 19 isoform X2 [Agrilus planipennis]